MKATSYQTVTWDGPTKARSAVTALILLALYMLVITVVDTLLVAAGARWLIWIVNWPIAGVGIGWIRRTAQSLWLLP